MYNGQCKKDSTKSKKSQNRTCVRIFVPSNKIIKFEKVRTKAPKSLLWWIYTVFTGTENVIDEKVTTLRQNYNTKVMLFRM